MKTPLLALALTIASLTPGGASSAPFTVSVIGHGRPMILIPGLSSGSETWTTTVDHFREHFECHVVTVAGFAGVPRAAGTPMLDQVTSGLADYLRAHRLEKAVIVGHSLGGYLALKFASEYPDLVGAVVDVDGYPDYLSLTGSPATPEQAKAIGEQIRTGMGAMTREAYDAYVRSGASTRMMVSTESDFQMLVKWGLASDPSAVAEAMGEMFGVNLEPALARITAPTLVLAAWQSYAQYTNHDRHMATLRRQFANLTGVQLELNDTAHHFIMWDDPPWLFEQMDRFLVTR